MKTLTKEEILAKHNIYRDAKNDAIGQIVLKAMQSFSDQENARLTAINEKQAELIESHETLYNYTHKPHEEQYTMTISHLKEVVDKFKRELQSLTAGEEKEEDKCTCQIADKGSHSNFCKRCNKHTY